MLRAFHARYVFFSLVATNSTKIIQIIDNMREPLSESFFASSTAVNCIQPYKSNGRDHSVDHITS